jgi:hypothetical protein
MPKKIKFESFKNQFLINANKTDFNYYLSKKASDNILYRGVSKWMLGVEDDLSYVGTKDEYLKILQLRKHLP